MNSHAFALADDVNSDRELRISNDKADRKIIALLEIDPKLTRRRPRKTAWNVAVIDCSEVVQSSSWKFTCRLFRRKLCSIRNRDVSSRSQRKCGESCYFMGQEMSTLHQRFHGYRR